MKREVTFLNSKNNKLYGYLYPGSSRSIIISSHGSHSYSSFPGIEYVFEYYQQLGFSVLRFDFSGYNKSEGVKSVVQRIDDIICAVNVFKNDYKEIIVSAQSLGALPAAIATSNSKFITKLIVLNGLFNFNQINPFLKLYINFQSIYHRSYPEEKRILAEMYAPEKIVIPTLVIYSDKDKIVDPKQSIGFFERLKSNKQLKVLHNSGHFPLGKDKFNVGFEITKKWLTDFSLPR